jgi:murein DD-endopeptidase MepM/ murein hydrolase activator NlpD
MRRRDRTWTVLITFASGRATRTLRIPRWAANGAGGLAALTFLLAVFVGWHMQALFGLAGSSVTQLGVPSFLAAAEGTFMSFARSRGMATAERMRRAAADRADRLGLGTRRAASQLLVGQVDPAWRMEAEQGRAWDGRLLWPVKNGGFGRGYGSGAGGYHLAVDIAGKSGTDVRAAAPGIVGYSGDALKGYGNVVMLVHPGGRATLYSHNERNLVIAGQRVARGETIAHLGSTGRSRGPHVHFEFIHDGRNCDPMPLVAPGPDSYKHFVPRFAATAWRPNAVRPSSVRCSRRIPHPGHEHEADTAAASNRAHASAARHVAGG